MVGRIRQAIVFARERLSPRVVTLLSVGVIFALSASIRFYTLDFGLPYLRHPDESHNVRHALRIASTGDLNPHFFRYPSLIFYVNALANLVYFWFAKLFGAVSQFSDIRPPVEYTWGTGAAQPPTPILLGRILSASFSVGTTLLGFAIGKRLGGIRAGLLCGALIALSPTNTAHARYLTPDSMTTFFVTLTLYGAVRVFERGKLSDYCLAGVAAGLAAGSKYNGGVVAIAIVGAHFARAGALKAWWRLCVAGATSAATFLVTTPYMLLDRATFMRDLSIAKVRYSDVNSGLAIDKQSSLEFYLAWLYQTEGAFIFLAGALLGVALLRRSRALLFFSVFPLAYLAFIGHYIVHNDRTLLPVIPALWILAGLGFLAIVDFALQFAKHKLAYASVVLVAVAALFIALRAEAMGSIDFARYSARRTITDEAREWLAVNLPLGARVALEPYGPFVDGRFLVTGFPSLSTHTPGWYVSRFDYLVLSAPPPPGPSAGARKRWRIYQSLKRAFPAAKIFSDGVSTVEVLRVH